MKTKKIFAVISLLLIFAAFNTSFAINPVGPIATNEMTTYVVYVDNSIGPILDQGTFLIGVGKNFGKLIAPPQVFQPDVLVYTFTEIGIPKGDVRVADMIQAPRRGNNLPVTVDPVIINGPFKLGKTYYFKLVPRKL